MPFWYRIGHTIARILFHGFFRYRAYNREKLESVHGSGALIASNHVSMFDPPLVGIAFRYAIYYLARKTLFDNPVNAFFYPRFQAIPVDQERPEFGALKKIIKLAKSGEKVNIFPEGERSEDGRILPGQAGVGLVIAKSKVPVVPVRIFGAYEALPRGRTFPKLFTPITVVIGDPIVFSDEELNVKDKDAYRALSQRVMDAIAEIENPRK